MNRTRPAAAVLPGQDALVADKYTSKKEISPMPAVTGQVTPAPVTGQVTPPTYAQWLDHRGQPVPASVRAAAARGQLR